MSNSWDPSSYQQHGVPQQQQPGNIKFFDPSQPLQQQYQQPPVANGNAGGQSGPSGNTAGGYVQPQPQPVQSQQHGQPQGQQSAWDNWGSWNWNAEGQDPSFSGHGHPVNQAQQPRSYSQVAAGGESSQQQAYDLDGQYDSQKQSAPQFYNPQGFQADAVATESSSAAEVQGSHSVIEYPGWSWDAIQNQWVPDESTRGQGEELEGSGQGQYLYQGQQSQSLYYNPSAWNSVDQSRGYSWGKEGDAAPAGQGGQEHPWQSLVGGDRGSEQAPQGMEAATMQSGYAHSVQDSSFLGVVSAVPVEDASSSTAAPSQPEGSDLQGHLRQGSADSSGSGTVSGFFGRIDDGNVHQPEFSVSNSEPTAATDPASVHLLQVQAPMQRTDSGISNASLQTLDTSAEEESKEEALEHMTNQLEAMKLQGSNYTPQQHTHSSQPHPGNFLDFGRFGEGLVVPGGCREKAEPDATNDGDEQSPVLNDWEFVPPQSNSPASQSCSDSLDGGITFSAPPPQLEENGEDRGNEERDAGEKSADIGPVKTLSGISQESESFTAISSTSGSDDAPVGSVPFSQVSGNYNPTASSTPFTSPGGQSILSQPSSIPSWQSSPTRHGPNSSPSPVLTVPASVTKDMVQSDRTVQISSVGVVLSSPDKVLAQLNQNADKRQQAAKQMESVRDTQGGSERQTLISGSSRPAVATALKGPPSKPLDQQKEKEASLMSPTRHHHSAFHPVHSQRAKLNMSPATTLWDTSNAAPPVGNILLAPAAPLIIPNLTGHTSALAGDSNTSTLAASVSASVTAPPIKKSGSSSGSLDKLSLREGGRRGRERDERLSRYTSSRRAGERGGVSKEEEFSRSRDDDNRSLGSLDELDTTTDLADESALSRDRSKGYNRDAKDARDPRNDSCYDRPSSRSDSYRDDYRRPRDYSYKSYGYREPYYDERYERPRSRQDEERSTRPSSRSAQSKDLDGIRPRLDYERDPRDPYRDVYRDPYRDPLKAGYEGYGPDYYYDEREKFYRYYRDSRYRHGYAEEMGQYYGHYDHRYGGGGGGYYGQPLPHMPPPSQHPGEDYDYASVASRSRGHTPAFDDQEHRQDYYSQGSRPSSRLDRDPYRQYGGYDAYAASYYNQQYQYYDYHGYTAQQPAVGGYQSGRMTPPKHILPHVRVCFGPTGQLVTVLPNRPAEGQPATVEIHDVSVLLQDRSEVDELKVFPGPLVRTETHKNDVLLFCQIRAKECASNVDMLDRESAELIWRLLELLLKQNGMVIGTDIADLLLSGHEPTTHEYAVSGLRISQSHNQSSDALDTPESRDSRSSSPGLKVATDRTVITAAQQLEESTDRFRHLLLYGRKKEALDWAMKRNLWGHALFLASKMDSRTHASVMTRFANTSMRMNDPLQTLYQLMSGRQPASVTNVVDERWGDWRPHLAMILSNHSSRPDLDKKSIVALGDTLATKHCLHASQFCYLMAQMDFGAYTKKNSKIVLIGSNHSLPLEDFATNEAIQCTEVYEYAMSLGTSKFFLPHYQVFRFLYACRLAENGLVQEAFHYFEVIAMQVLCNPSCFTSSFVSILYSTASKLKHADPQKLHDGHDSADPTWLSQLSAVCQGFEDGSIQFTSGSATPMTGYGAMTPSSESGEVAGYGMDSTAGGSSAFSHDASAYTSYTQGPHQGMAGQPESSLAAVDENGQYTGDQNGQYTSGGQQQGEAEQYSWQQQQQQLYQQQSYQQQDQQQQQQQLQYDQGLYQQQQWPGYDYSQVYSTEHQSATQPPTSDFGGESAYQQQQQQALPSSAGLSKPNPQQQHSLSGQGNTEEDDEDDDDEEDDDDDDDDDETVGGEGPESSNFDYFGAATQQKIVVPKSRYRTTSTSSTGSQRGERRQRNFSSSSQGSVRAAKPPSAPAKSAANSKKASAEQQKNGGSGWLGGLFNKLRPSGKNEMKLPDDKNPAIVWDAAKKMWVNKDKSENETTVTAPPPTDTDLMKRIPSTNSIGNTGGAPPTTNGPPVGNKFSKPKGRGARYVDVLNPGGGSTGSSPVPPNLFNVLPAANTNSSAAVSTSQIYNPAGGPDTSSSQTTVSSVSNLLPPSHELSRSSSLSSLSREIQQLTMKAHREFGDGGSNQQGPDGGGLGKPAPPSLPMMFNPATLGSSSGQPPAVSTGMKYGQRRVYPK